VPTCLAPLCCSSAVRRVQRAKSVGLTVCAFVSQAELDDVRAALAQERDGMSQVESLWQDIIHKLKDENAALSAAVSAAPEPSPSPSLALPSAAVSSTYGLPSASGTYGMPSVTYGVSSGTYGVPPGAAGVAATPAYGAASFASPYASSGGRGVTVDGGGREHYDSGGGGGGSAHGVGGRGGLAAASTPASSFGVGLTSYGSSPPGYGSGPAYGTGPSFTTPSWQQQQQQQQPPPQPLSSASSATPSWQRGSAAVPPLSVPRSSPPAVPHSVPSGAPPAVPSTGPPRVPTSSPPPPPLPSQSPPQLQPSPGPQEPWTLPTKSPRQSVSRIASLTADLDALRARVLVEVGRAAGAACAGAPRRSCMCRSRVFVCTERQDRGGCEVDYCACDGGVRGSGVRGAVPCGDSDAPSRREP
jgi:hypothetical protein